MEIKGTAVIAIRDFVKINYAEKYSEWVGSLSDGSKAIFSGVIDASKWYPLNAAGIVPTKKIAEMFFSGDYKKGAWIAGQFSAQKALTGIYKIFVKASTPAYIIQRASRVFATYYQPCQIIVKDKHDKHVMLELSNMTESDIVIEYRIAGWIVSALEISGSQNVTVTFPSSISKGDEVTLFDINWE